MFLINFQVAKALLTRGHEVHSYMNGDCKDTKKMADVGVTVHAYTNVRHGCMGDDEAFKAKHMSTIIEETSIFKLLKFMREANEVILAEVNAFLDNKEVIKKMDLIGFDLCILDGIFTQLYYRIIPYKLGIPTISMVTALDAKLAGLPALPSFTPYINSGTYTDEMTFMERVVNTLMTYGFDAMISLQSPGSDNGLISKYAPEKPFVSLKHLEGQSMLWLVLTDVAIDYPLVRMPHVVNIGGINTRPPKPIQEKFQSFADDAKRGLIVVSFGSFFSTFPEKLEQKLLSVFRQLEERVIWKLPNVSKDDVPANVYLAKWIPQNDLLAHPNTKLFITHCGANGQFEALYNGVPMLGLPLFADQIYNSRRMAKKGMGIHMDFFNVRSDEILSAVKEILSNDSYQSTMDVYSAMFKDGAMTPIEKTVYWIEHVIKYGAVHLMSPALEYPWYKFYCIDVVLFLILVGGTVSYVGYVGLRLMCRCICRRRGGKMKHQWSTWWFINSKIVYKCSF